MQYRKLGKQGLELPALGFGAMRLPLLSDDPGDVDESGSIKLIRHAIDRGISYVDTAYNYHKGKSEIIVGKALKEGYREKTRVATKLPGWLINTYWDFDKYLNEQLSKLDVECIDFYLIHNLNQKYWNSLVPLGVLEFLNRARQQGKIRYAGFSFHDNVELFKRIIDSYDWDFCQIQYNYMDEHFQAGTEGLRYAAARNIPVIVMEPLQGGKLAKEPPQSVKALWDTANTKRTPAEWGLRWVLNHPEVGMVLSGMNTLEQVDENIRAAEAALPGTLTEEEIKLVKAVENEYRKNTAVYCTGCGYCMPCPAKVWIPYNFELLNDYFIYETKEASAEMYDRLMKSGEAAAFCMGCGRCEMACPQRLPVVRLLNDVDRILRRSLSV